MEYHLGRDIEGREVEDRDVEVFDDLEALSHASAKFVIEELSKSISTRSVATIALAGGETPKRLYEILATEYKDSDVWRSTHFFLGDERCVPMTDPKSNFRMINETLFTPLGISPENIHRPDTALASPKEIAAGYGKEIRDFFAAQPIGFDVILLGMGADGHTASIFPDTIIGSEASEVARATLSPIPPRDRVTVTMPVINASRVALVQVSGSEKAPALARVLELPISPGASLPAARVGTRERTCFFVDRAARGTVA